MFITHYEALITKPRSQALISEEFCKNYEVVTREVSFQPKIKKKKEKKTDGPTVPIRSQTSRKLQKIQENSRLKSAHPFPESLPFLEFLER